MNRILGILLILFLLSFSQSWGAALQFTEGSDAWYGVDYENTTSGVGQEDLQQKTTRIYVDGPAGRVGTLTDAYSSQVAKTDTAYDPIGNRKFSLTDEDSTAGHDADYTSNSLNQYILRRTGE